MTLNKLKLFLKKYLLRLRNYFRKLFSSIYYSSSIKFIKGDGFLLIIFFLFICFHKFVYKVDFLGNLIYLIIGLFLYFRFTIYLHKIFVNLRFRRKLSFLMLLTALPYISAVLNLQPEFLYTLPLSIAAICLLTFFIYEYLSIFLFKLKKIFKLKIKANPKSVVKNMLMIIPVMLLFAMIYFVISIFMYQRLTDEGIANLDRQCFDVNPLIIQRKNTYINTLKIMKENGTVDDYWKEQKKYLDISEKFVKAQEIWLHENFKFRNRPDFVYFLPSDIQEYERARYDWYQAEAKSTGYVIEMFKTLEDVERQKDLYRMISDEAIKKKNAEEKMERISKTNRKFDLRNIFIKNSSYKCPAENWDIPDVLKFLEPSVPFGGGAIS